MKQLIFLLALSIPLQATAAWQPPPKPDPDAILDEARADTRAGRYEDALERHLWFHHHALEYRPSLYGVRLSFALGYWLELAKAYPPALTKLKEVRDDAEKKVIEGKGDVRRLFHDMSSINEELGDDDRTVAAFIQLDKTAPKSARDSYNIAQPALVKAKKYDLCGKYLEPEKSYELMVRIYRLSLKHAEERKEPAPPKRMMLESAEEAFLEDSATLIALLVLNNRKSEAEKIAEDARNVSMDPNRDPIIDSALKGELPKSRFDRPDKQRHTAKKPKS